MPLTVVATHIASIMNQSCLLFVLLLQGTVSQSIIHTSFTITENRTENEVVGQLALSGGTDFRLVKLPQLSNSHVTDLTFLYSSILRGHPQTIFFYDQRDSQLPPPRSLDSHSQTPLIFSTYTEKIRGQEPGNVC